LSGIQHEMEAGHKGCYTTWTICDTKLGVTGRYAQQIYYKSTSWSKAQSFL